MQTIEEHGIASHHAIRAVREIIRRAILTFEADPSPFSKLKMGAPSYARQYAGDYAETKLARYRPSGHEIDQAMVVLPWLQWLREHHGTGGSLAVRRMIRWAHGVQNTEQGRREGCSAKTIQNRIDRDVALIIERFFSLGCRIQVVDEPYQQTPFAMHWDDPSASFPNGFGEVRIMTVYVHGKGMMRNGKPWNDGSWRAERMEKKCA